jgi:putative GTP pyrophosphokinase
MLVEIQYRTAAQHAWATAVELAGLITENNPKFNRGSSDFVEYFGISSEMISRVFENLTSCFPQFSSSDLAESFYEVDAATHLSRLFSELQASEGQLDPKRPSILIFRFDPDLFEEKLEIRSHDSINSAIQEYNLLEKTLSDSADIVLVGSRSEEAIKSAYRNYFSDAKEFVQLIEQAVEITGEAAAAEISELTNGV